MSVSIIVSTYGDHAWEQIARDRALPSCEGQGALEVVFTHMPAGTVSRARNAGAEASAGEFLVFLDGDDELRAGYVMAMNNAALQVAPVMRGRTLYTPAVSYVTRGQPQRPKFWPQVDYRDANWLVIGTMVSRRLFDEVGGFTDWGDPPGSNAYEDWALWASCQHREDVEVVKVPEAVYVAHVDSGSRHRGADHETRVGWHYEIGHALFPERYDERWLKANSPRHRRGATARGRQG